MLTSSIRASTREHWHWSTVIWGDVWGHNSREHKMQWLTNQQYLPFQVYRSIFGLKKSRDKLFPTLTGVMQSMSLNSEGYRDRFSQQIHIKSPCTCLTECRETNVLSVWWYSPSTWHKPLLTVCIAWGGRGKRKGQSPHAPVGGLSNLWMSAKQLQRTQSITLKRIVSPKKKLMSVLTQNHDVPNL